MHSTGSIDSRWQRTARPVHSGGTSAEETTWFGTTSASRSNHHSESWVRTAPLSGICVGSTTSKTEIRSEATSSRSSPSAQTSRTLPECSSSTTLSPLPGLGGQPEHGHPPAVRLGQPAEHPDELGEVRAGPVEAAHEQGGQPVPVGGDPLRLAERLPHQPPGPQGEPSGHTRVRG